MSVDRVNIRLAGGYPLDQLDRLIRDVEPLLTVAEASHFHLDLSGLVMVGPTGLALLHAALARLQHDGLIHGGEFELPNSPLTRQYLLRMDFLKGLVSEEDAAESFERKEPVGFREVQHFETDEEYPGVARTLTQALLERCKTDTLGRAAILICLNELTENVVHHAASPYGGYAAAQGWRKNNEFEIGIVDLGIGVTASLNKNDEHADLDDDVAAIRTAMEPRSTSTPDRNSGMGLAVTEMLLRENGGKFVVRSGVGAVRSGAESAGKTTEVRFPGTVVALRARTDRPLDLKTVYRQLPDDPADHHD